MDPLSQAIQLLRPRELTWKEGEFAGDWGLRFPGHSGVAFCLIAAGGCRLERRGARPIQLTAGDFVLMAAPTVWALCDGEPATMLDGAVGHLGLDRFKRAIGAGRSQPATRLLGGHFALEAGNDDLLAALAPPLVLIRPSDPASDRLRGVLDLIAAEAFSDRPGRALILERLLEVMLVEAIRQSGATANPGLLTGLADRQVAAALRAMHGDVARQWTVGDLAAVGGASRSAFAARFTRIVGMAPIDYLLSWRMALARDALVRDSRSLSDIALECGYQSASAFSTAFRREVGCPPAEYRRERRQGAPSSGSGARA